MAITDETASLELAGASDIGTVRKENQDAWDAVSLSEGALATLLADGMGGHRGGGEAASAAVAAAVTTLAGAQPGVAPAALVQEAATAATAAVAELRAGIGGSPGTTLIIAVVHRDGTFTLGNIGDSRAYHVRRGQAVPVTEDHSWVGDQVRQGLLDPAEARHHPSRNMITRAVLGDQEAPDIFRGQLQPGEALLLCSDGVWEPLEDAALAALANDGPVQQAADAICRGALEAGSKDNVTAVLLRRVR